MPRPEIVWFRRDLRLRDNPAWSGASDRIVVALWVHEPALWSAASPARRKLLSSHLGALDRELAERGGRLRIEQGPAAVAVPAVAEATGATIVHWNDDVTAWSRNRDDGVARRLTASGVRTDRHWGTLVHRPGSVTTGAGTVARIFAAFHQKWLGEPWDPWPSGDPAQVLDERGVAAAILPERSVADAGERGATARLADFEERIERYPDERDLPSLGGTSALSGDLHFGTISPRSVVERIGRGTKAREAFVRQIAWRDWFAHLLWTRPQLQHHAMRGALDRIAWRNDPADISAWRAGRTGYPLVDAGMRELTESGRMHNRIRMATASFLVKDLLVDWRIGERWFRRWLLDADVAQNVGNWQWCAGTGPDAAPYFRVFNPIAQSKRFDPSGTFIRRWVPEVAGLDDHSLHAPWQATPLELAAAGIVLGTTYPAPVVDHAFARNRALDAYRAAIDSPDTQDPRS